MNKSRLRSESSYLCLVCLKKNWIGWEVIIVLELMSMTSPASELTLTLSNVPCMAVSVSEEQAVVVKGICRRGQH